MIGREGQLARSLAERAPLLGLRVQSIGRPQIDLARPEGLEAAIGASQAAVIINSAAYTAVDDAESEPEIAWQINASAPGIIAAAAAARGARLIHVSTDYVFDGSSGEPYSEEDAVSPLNTYGRTKLAGERAVRAAGGQHAIVRTSWVYSPFGRNFVKTMLSLAESRPEIRVVADQVGTPTSALDLADALLVMVKSWRSDPARGAGELFHFAGSGATNWAALAAEIFRVSGGAGGPSAKVVPISSGDYATPAARPANSRLSSAKFSSTFGHRAPAWQESVALAVGRLMAGRKPPD